MIDHTKAKSNRELLEAATSFKFPGYEYFEEATGKEGNVTLYINEMSIYGHTFWRINCSFGTYDRAEKHFMYYAAFDFQESTRFYDIYEALETVRGLIK